jgi:uncharacterized repeat protein (TIGR02543 family)
MKTTKAITLLAAMLFAANAIFADTETVNGITWNYTVSGGEAQIYKNSSSAAIPTSTKGDITIPGTLGGYPVTSIGYRAFYGCSGLASVTIPDSVTSIGGEAFDGCSSLTSVTIPDSVTNIGALAFRGCSGLTSVTIPDSVTSIGDEAFSGCSGLTSVTIPDSVTSIGDDAFYRCSGLTSVTIPDSVKSIRNFAFYGCSSLTSLTIPNSLTNIGDYAFFDCSGLTSVTIPDSVTSIGEGVFLCCRNLSAIKLGNGVKTIGDIAFNNCQSLRKLRIPDSVESLGRNVFTGCDVRLFDNVSIPGVKLVDGWCVGSFDYLSGVLDLTGVRGIASGSFGSIEMDVSYDSWEDPVPYLEDVHDSWMLGDILATRGNLRISSVIISGTTRSIGKSAFAGCERLETVSIGNGVESIGQDAFAGCVRLKTVSIGNGVKSIGQDAFWACERLKTVSIGNGVKSIGDGAFAACEELSSIVIPSSVTCIGNAFFNCTKLRTIYLHRNFLVSMQYAAGSGADLILPLNCVAVFYDTIFTFDQQGGTGGETLAAAASKTALPAVTPPTRSGYIFTGYWTGANGTGTQIYGPNGKKVCNWTGSESATLYAGWTKRKFSIAFKANGGTGKMAKQTVTYGKAVKLNSNTFTRSGWLFLGWAKSTSRAVVYTTNASIKGLASEASTVTLYAVWAKKTYKVAFYANGGKGTMSVESFTYGKAKKLSANKFTAPKGKKFSGWAKSKALAKKGKVAYKNTAKVKNLVTTGKTVKLYAVWKKR